MKNILLVLILIVFIVTGCSASKAQSGTPDQIKEDISGQVKENAPDQAKKGIAFNVIKFENVDLDNAPKKISDLYEINKEKCKVIAVDEDNFTYIIAMMGQKSTGGYSIKVNSITDAEEGKLAVTLEMSKPEPGSMVIQALTYPVDIVKIPKTNLPIYAVDTQGNKIEVESLR